MLVMEVLQQYNKHICHIGVSHRSSQGEGCLRSARGAIGRHLPPSVTSMIWSLSKQMQLVPSALCHIEFASGPLWRSVLLCLSIVRLFFSWLGSRPSAARMPHMAADVRDTQNPLQVLRIH